MRKRIFIILVVFCVEVFLFSQTKILKKADSSNPKYLKPDFQIIEAYSYTSAGKKMLRVKVKNNGTLNYSGDLPFKIQYLGPSYNSKIAISKSVSITAGKVKMIDLIQLPRIGCKGEKVKIIVDPLNEIPEMDEGNNAFTGKIFKYNTFDGRVEMVRLKRAPHKYVSRRTSVSRRIIRISPQDIEIRDKDKVMVLFDVTISNCGSKLIKKGTASLSGYYVYASKCGNQNKFVLGGKVAKFENFSAETKNITLPIKLPLYTVSSSDKKCFKIDKLFVKIYYYISGETGSRTSDNALNFFVEYTSDTGYYRQFNKNLRNELK